MRERLWLVDGIDGGDGVVDPSEVYILQLLSLRNVITMALSAERLRRRLDSTILK